MTPKQQRFSASRKTCRPFLHKVLARPRLFSLLDEASSQPLTAVLAAPGYGKTTLVSSYVASKKAPSIWYCVDEGDTDLAGFFVHFTAAIKQATASRRKTIPTYQAENFLNVKAFARRYFNAVYQRFDQPFTLVFDDIHECPFPKWADVITVAIETLPVNGRIFIMSRQALPGAFSRLRLNQVIYALEEKNLLFNDDELTQLAGIHQVNHLSQAQCMNLQEVMAGWGAGLTLLLSRREQLDPSALQSFDTQEELLNYFKNEVLKHLDDQTRDILYRTCYLPDLPITHAKQLTPHPQVGDILKKLHDRRYFIYRTTDAAIVYRYHPLFRTLLMAQSKAVLSDQNLAQVRATSIRLLENDGALQAAVTLLIQIRDEVGLAAFTLKHAKTLLSGKRVQTLMKCLQYLPEERINASGWLLYWRGSCTASLRPQNARQDFSAAFKFFTSHSDATGQCLSIVGIIDTHMFERNEFISLDPWIAQATQLRTRFDAEASTAALNALSLNMFSTLIHRAPGHPDFDLWLERIEKIPMSELPPGLRVRRQLTLTLHRIWQGDFHRAATHHSVLEKQLKNSAEDVSGILWYIIHCCFLWATTARAETALAVAKTGLQRIKEYGLPLMNIALWTHGAAAALMAHNNEGARKLLQAAEPYANEAGQTHLALYHNLQAIYSSRMDDLEAVAYHAEAFFHSAMASGLPFFQASAHLTQAQYYLLRRDINKTRQHLQASKDIALHTQNYFHQFQVQLLNAILDDSLGKQASALLFLKNALALGNRYHLLPGLWLCEAALTEILALALRQKIETPTALRIIQARALMPEDPPDDIEGWPWPLRIYTLGRFEIVVDGERLASPSRNRPKVTALLKTLIAFGGTEVREEVISETIWPDADGDAAHQLFDTTLFRLRKILGRYNALINCEGMLSLNKRVCWLDTWALDRTINTSSELLKDNYSAINSIKKYEDLLHHYYRGDFLQAEEQLPIIIQQRQKIRSKFRHALYQLAEYCLINKRSEELESCLKKITNTFPEEEKAYRMLMKLFRSQGRFSDAAQSYQTCKQALMIALNVRPSSETEREYERLPKMSSKV